MVSLGWRNDLMKQKSKVLLNYLRDIQFGRHTTKPPCMIWRPIKFSVSTLLRFLCAHIYYTFSQFKFVGAQEQAQTTTLCVLLSFRIANCTSETQPIFRIFCCSKGRFICSSLNKNYFIADFLPALRVRKW